MFGTFLRNAVDTIVDDLKHILSMATKGGYVVVYNTTKNAPLSRLAMEKTNRCRLRSGTLAGTLANLCMTSYTSYTA